jgi:endoglucanase
MVVSADKVVGRCGVDRRGKGIALRVGSVRRLTFVAAVVAATIALSACSQTAERPNRPSAAAPKATAPATSTPAPTPPPTATPSTGEIFPGGFYRDPHTAAAEAEDHLTASGDLADAAVIAQISSQPTAIWLGDWLTNAQLAKELTAAQRERTTLVFVTYAIPNRDCGGLSAGGLSATDYLTWNQTIAETLAGSHSVVLVEPDSLAMLTADRCAKERATRPALIHQAVAQLASAGLTVYLDGGNSNWVKPQTMADLLRSAGVAEARGFFTNVSNFYREDQERPYADGLSSKLGGKHFVIDVSRNGNGWKGTWCNPSGVALGQPPTVVTGDPRLDALLWVKAPGKSDGTCNGGPAAGLWWEDYALDLVRNR